MRLIEAIRSETRELHAALERKPLAAALANGTIRIDEVAALHATYLAIHEALEARLDDSQDIRVIAVWRSEQARASDLRADLEMLPAPTLPDTVKAIVARSLEHAAHASPARLLGWLYVFEGSRLGGAVLAPRIAAAIDRPPLRYYAGNHATMAAWRGFCGRLEAIVAVEVAEVIAGALDAYALFTGVFDALRGRELGALQRELDQLDRAR